MVELLNIQVTENAGTEPVSLEDIKSYLGVDYADKDTEITAMGKSARMTIERYCNTHLLAKAVTLDVEVTGDCEQVVTLPFTKTVTGLTVKELDDEDQTTDLTAGTDFYTRGNTIRITPGRYAISYTTVPVVTEDLKEAIKMEVVERFAHKGDDAKGISQGAKEKAQPHQVIWL